MFFSIHLPCKVPREVLKTEGEARGFQHFLHVYMVPYLHFSIIPREVLKTMGFAKISTVLSFHLCALTYFKGTSTLDDEYFRGSSL